MEKAAMSKNNQTEKLNHGPVKQRQIRFTEEGVKTQYAGVFNINFGAEEVYLSFGNLSMDTGVVRIESKVAVSLKTAKRLAIALGGLLQRYEAANGPLDIMGPKTGEVNAKQPGAEDNGEK